MPISPTSQTLPSVFPIHQPDQFNALAKALTIPDRSGAWTVNRPIGGTLTCDRTGAIFSMEQSDSSPCNAMLINALVHVAEWQNPGVQCVDLSKLSPNPDLFALSRNHPNVQGWVFPLSNEVEDCSGLDPQFFWLCFKDQLLGVKVANLPEDCCLRNFADNAKGQHLNLVDAATLPFGDFPCVWKATLFEPDEGQPSSLEGRINKIHLLDFLGLTDRIRAADSRFFLSGFVTFDEWLQVVEMLNSIGKELLPTVHRTMKDLARDFLDSALKATSMPDWLKEYPLTKLWEYSEVGETFMEGKPWPCKKHNIDLLLSPQTRFTCLRWLPPTTPEDAAYLVAKAKQHPSLRVIRFAVDRYANDVFELEFFGPAKKCKAWPMAASHAVPISRLLPKPISVLVGFSFSNLGADIERLKELHAIEGVKSRRGSWGPISKCIADLCLLPFFHTFSCSVNPFGSDFSTISAGIKAHLDAGKIKLILNSSDDVDVRRHSLITEELDLPVKCWELGLKQSGLNAVLAALPETQRHRIRHLDLLEDLRSADQVEQIPFHLMPNLRRVSVDVGPKALPALKEKLALYPAIKKCILSLNDGKSKDDCFSDADLQHLPVGPKQLSLQLCGGQHLTIDGLCSVIKEHPGFVNIVRFNWEWSDEELRPLRETLYAQRT